VNIAMFAAITITVIVAGMTVCLGLVLLFISKNKLKMLYHPSGIQQPYNNEMERYTMSYSFSINYQRNSYSIIIAFTTTVIHNKQIGIWFMKSNSLLQ
jgi:hypothetical protein